MVQIYPNRICNRDNSITEYSVITAISVRYFRFYHGFYYDFNLNFKNIFLPNI